MQVTINYQMRTLTICSKTPQEEAIIASLLILALKPGELLSYEIVSYFENEETSNLYWYKDGLIYLGKVDVNNQTHLVFTGGYCKKCNANIIKPTEYRFKICDKCAGKCSHEFVDVAPNIELGDIKIQCTICGRTKAEIYGTGIVIMKNFGLAEKTS